MVAARRAFFIPVILIASTVFTQAADPTTLRVADSFPVSVAAFSPPPEASSCWEIAAEYWGSRDRLANA
jgi:hypothetical protein